MQMQQPNQGFIGLPQPVMNPYGMNPYMVPQQPQMLNPYMAGAMGYQPMNQAAYAQQQQLAQQQQMLAQQRLASDPIASWNMATQQPQYQVNQFGQPVNQFGQPIMVAPQQMPQQFLGYPQQQRPVFPTVGGQQPVQQQVALQQPMQPQVGWGMPKFNKL